MLLTPTAPAVKPAPIAALGGEQDAVAQDPETDVSYQEWLAQRQAGLPESGSAEPSGNAVHVDIAVDWVSAYYFRGLLQERRDHINQNSVQVGFDILEPETHAAAGGPFVDLRLTAFFGIWNSFHEAATGAVSSDQLVEHWYEADLYLGLTAEHGRWNVGATFYAYTSPSDAFSTSDELALTVSCDDSGLWGDVISFSPSLTLAVETRGGADGMDPGVYLGLGLTPAFDVTALSRSVTLSFPLTVGISASDYYQDGAGKDQSFGYIDLGAEFATDLPVATRFGSWSLSGGVHWLVLGDNTQVVNEGRDNQLYGRVGLAISF